MPTVSRAAQRGLSPLALLLTLACGGETLGPPLPDQSTLYWDLSLNHHAVTLSTTAPYDTLSLVATPRSIRQEPLAGLPAPQWVSQDPERVLVTPEGVLVAVAPTAAGTQVKVTATLTTGNLKHTDYVFVRVVANPAPPVLATLSVQPLLPDSAKVAARRDGLNIHNYQLPMRATDAMGVPITDLLVSFRSSDRRIADINEITGMVSGYLPGRLNFYATATAFGITKADTLPFRIGFPIASQILITARTDGTPGNFLRDPELKVGVGAEVLWQASNADATRDIDITFTDPTHVVAHPSLPIYSLGFARLLCDGLSLIQPETVDCTGSGNFVITSFFRQNSTPPSWFFGVAARGFPVAGTYDFHSTLQGFSGRIIVVDESEP